MKINSILKSLDGYVDDAARIAKDTISKTSAKNLSISGIAQDNAITNAYKSAQTLRKPITERGIGGSIRGIKEQGVRNAGEAIKQAHLGTDGKADYLSIAGSFIGASAAYRVASGGGLYKDKNGNANIIGVPFI